ncbi:MAG: NAD(P)/FAD-dependent oxidoreductase [Lachnospiraceae bacterium]|nr:NAD(P)/FAD-dependent oxidoreductase [Lachnospiraceae bacterium]MDE6980828.1 NAD(P)/FAD-dependent oxidoreductase [Lachnospiraceae bacterium]
MRENKKKIVIVGGGIAGLAAGIYGKMADYDVEIYEKNPIPGGQCMGWNRKGCHIDNCIHWLTGTKKGTSLRKVWETVGALEEDTKFAQCESFYTSVAGDVQITLWKDLERTKSELLSLSPEDEVEIKKFIEHVKYAAECEMPAEKPMDAMGIIDYIHMGASMANMPKVMKEYGAIDLLDMAGRFKHPALKALFTDYLPSGYVASSFLVSYASIISGNGEIPMGGSLAMVERMVKRFQQLGGKLYCNAPVMRILIKDGKATGIEKADKERVLADYVISSVDTMEMFRNLIGKKYMDAKWMSCYSDSEKYPLFSSVQAAFAVDQGAYDGKGTIFFDCLPFETGGKKVERMSVKSYEYEPTFAPRGKIVLQVNVQQFDKEYLYWKGLTREEYECRKKEAVKAIEERLLTQFPKLQGHLEFLDCWTPVTYERYCNAYHGAYMGFITKKGVKSFRVKGTIKGVKNLYIASQWIMAPGGLPVAVTAGKFAVWRIARKDKRKIKD